jgi:hypothetical protein
MSASVRGGMDGPLRIVVTLSSSKVEGNGAVLEVVVFGGKDEEDVVVLSTTWSCDVRCRGAMILWVCLVLIVLHFVCPAETMKEMLLIQGYES